MNEENVVRLAKPRGKLSSILFSRLPIILLLLIIQVLIYVGIFVWLSRYSSVFFLIMSLFELVMIIYLFMSSIDSSAKLTWLFVIFVAPIAGAVFFAYTQSNLGHRTLQKRAGQMIEMSRTAIAQDEAVAEELRKMGGDVDDLSTYLMKSGCFPVYRNTDVTYFPLGEDKFKAMLEELEKAEKFIFMEYFIVEEGEMWGRILDILIRKAAAGIDVRVSYDGMCEISQLPQGYWKLLEKHGIKARSFAPIMPILSSHYNYRDHRKILVIDGKVAFTGGVNLADEYINLKERFGHWKDTAIMLKGEAVRSFTLLFLQMWNIGEKEPKFAPWINAPCEPVSGAEGYVMPYGDCPLDAEKAGEMVYMDILNRAGEYVHIMTPYLILDGELETALIFAAERGVDVKLILPGIPDKKFAFALAKSHYKRLHEAGVKLYEYTPGFVHAKVFVSDDVKAVVGTINLDYRSLYHHFECAAFLYKTACISDIEKDFQETLAKCRPVTSESIKHEKLSYKLTGAFLKFLAPLM